MRKTISFVLTVIVAIISILLLSVMPEFIQINRTGTTLNWRYLWEGPAHYFSGLYTGASFHFMAGETPLNYIKLFPGFFWFSMKYLAIAIFISIIIGLLLSLLLAHQRRVWIKDVLGFFGSIPDFLFILLLQVFAVFIDTLTNAPLIKVASFSNAHPAVFLPLITLIVIPSLYLIHSLASHTYDVLTEDYIRTAVSKGLRVFSIYKNHVLRNTIPFLKSELHKVLGIAFGNLFIVEYLFNLRGLTQLISAYTYPYHANAGGGTIISYGPYQYQVAVNSFVLLMVLYTLLYALSRLLIWGIERVFAHE